MKLTQILRDSNYKLTQFTEKQIQNLENQIIEKESKGKITYKVVCLVRKKEVVLTPEEVVRQLYLMVLTEQYQYPLNRIIVEFPVTFGSDSSKRADMYEEDIKNLIIPILPQEIQSQISSQVQESFRLRAESERLLALAKEAVEVAIEKGEERGNE